MDNSQYKGQEGWNANQRYGQRIKAARVATIPSELANCVADYDSWRPTVDKQSRIQASSREAQRERLELGKWLEREHRSGLSLLRSERDAFHAAWLAREPEIERLRERIRELEASK